MTTPYLVALPTIATEPRADTDCDDPDCACNDATRGHTTWSQTLPHRPPYDVADVIAMTREEELLATIQHVRAERDAAARRVEVLTRYATGLRGERDEANELLDECAAMARNATKGSDLERALQASLLVARLTAPKPTRCRTCDDAMRFENGARCDDCNGADQ